LHEHYYLAEYRFDFEHNLVFMHFCSGVASRAGHVWWIGETVREWKKRHESLFAKQETPTARCGFVRENTT